MAPFVPPDEAAGKRLLASIDHPTIVMKLAELSYTSPSKSPPRQSDGKICRWIYSPQILVEKVRESTADKTTKRLLRHLGE
jgi:hypothetical protein